MIFKSNLTLLLISLFAISTFAVLAPGEKAIPLLKDGKGFYIQANLGNKTHPNLARFVPSFSTETSFFFKNSSGFTPYNCSECVTGYEDREYSIPELPPMSYSSKLKRFYDPNSEATNTFWGFSRRVWVQSLQTPFVDYEQKRTGILGLGYRFNDVQVKLPKAFSVLVNKEETKAALFYTNPPSKERTPLFTLSNRNTVTWQFFMNGKLTSPSQFNLWGFLTFDLNAQALGFTAELYREIFNGIKREMGCKNAQETDWKPKCSFSGDIKKLSPIKFESDDVGQISIPPEVYIDSVTNGVATLNIKKVGRNMTGVHYINIEETWDSKLKSRIILDAKFMKQYETVFDMSNLEDFNVKFYSLEGTRFSVDDAKEVPEPSQDDEETIEFSGVVRGYLRSKGGKKFVYASIEESPSKIQF